MGRQILRQILSQAALSAICVMLPIASAGADVAARPQQKLAAGRSVATLEADQQRREGPLVYADGHVDVMYEDMRLQADHILFHDDTKVIEAHGHIQFDRDVQHLEADEGRYELRSGRGFFKNVRGTIRVQRRPNRSLLVSPNPLYFEAAEADRLDENTYEVHNAWLTVCKPNRPTWTFHAPKATIHLEKSVQLQGASFRLFSIPVIYLPYASMPAGRKVRQSGFLIPDVGKSSRKGNVFGDSFYWAPTEWMDAMVGAQFMSRRGYSQHERLRMQPWENLKLDVSFFGVKDRGLPGQSSQGGHEYHIGLDAFLPQGWRAVADLNELSSLTFRLAFGETFSEAVNSEVHNTAFLTNNFRGFSLDFASLSYKNFLSTSPETSIFLRTAPEVRFGSVPQAPWARWPFYFGFTAFADAVHRGENVPGGLQTAALVQRTELAPNVTIPLRWGPWLGVTPSFTLRSTRYGEQLQNGAVLGRSLVRTTEEFSVDLRPPAFDRIWGDGDTKWKHVVEPQVVYRFVNGVNQFGRFLRFDENETLTDTNEVEYGVTQRLFRKAGSGDAEELVSWRIAQKYYFDPTFGGAIVAGERNVLQALDSITPFAFADTARSYSPVVSDLRITPGGRYDAQFRVDYDPRRRQMTAVGTLLKVRPYREAFVTLAHFSTVNLKTPSSPPNLAPRSNQLRALIGYGDLNRRGWNGAFGFSYDVTQHFFQNQVAQISYNGSCCGLGFEFRRLSLGTVRVENQYRIVLMIANIGSAGNLRRQEKVF
jgi:LPS-assembly protein